MSDVLEMADVLARIEIQRDEGVGVEIVSWLERAIDVRRRVADDEIDAVCLQIDGGILPHASAKGLIGIAVFGEYGFLGFDIAMHVAARGILRRPDANRALWDGVKVPELLACLC